MSIISLPFTFTAGATIIAAQFNSNFQTIYNDYNGNVTNANIASSATFPDSVLQQIQTAGKVNGSALTLFANIPSAAGIMPTANLGSGTANTTTFLRGDQTWAIAAPAYIKLSNTQANTVNGGSATLGSWTVIPINTTDLDTGSNVVSNSGGTFVLVAGTYDIIARNPFFKTSNSQSRLQNTTDATTIVLGSNTVAGTGIQSDSFIQFRFVIAASKSLQFQYRCNATEATDGLGTFNGFGNSEVYATIQLWKVA